ncbi:unnamed protein product, partial [Closterium sp. Naga37s-1]
KLDWRDWVCPGCIRCEACQRYGEPSSIVCCYRCDRGYHVACTQLHTKSPFKGPFVCPSHTQCHSCGSKVPGSGTSSRWFFNYMLCDACGRLFVKKKHCPVCLRESTAGEGAARVGQPGWGSLGGAAGVGQLGWGSWGGAAGVGQLGWGSWGVGAAGGDKVQVRYALGGESSLPSPVLQGRWSGAAGVGAAGA